MDNVQVAHVLRSRAQAIREADPLQRPVFAHLGSYTAGSGRDWTQGCIALDDDDIRELYPAVPIGTPVKIVP